jgi:hypothetical protein
MKSGVLLATEDACPTPGIECRFARREFEDSLPAVWTGALYPAARTRPLLANVNAEKRPITHN